MAFHMAFADRNPYISRMTDAHTIAFAKMNGLGNDFVIIDARQMPLTVTEALTAAQLRHLASRDNDTTKGCDQLLVIHKPRQTGDAFMQIFNADGSEVEACGNGTRAVAAFLAKAGQADTKLESLGGMLTCKTHAHDGGVSVSVVMPEPDIGGPVELHADLPDALPVNVGNPHAVIFVETGTAGLAAQYGFQLEHHTAFPERANINFASLQADNVLRLDTWERGVGLTRACGTGACATAVAAVARGLCMAGDIIIRPPHNQNDNDTDVLTIDYRPGAHLIMTGPVAFEFDGEATL